MAGQARLGFYPADPDLARQIGSLLNWPTEKLITLLDPSCGEGEALAAFNQGRGRTYGVELARVRSQTAAGVLDRVMHGAFEQARISTACFSACWLNPPYDDELGGGKRTELRFLQSATPLLVSGGVLVFFFSASAWSERLRDYLSSRYERVRVFRHPPTDRPGYADINVYIVLAIKRREPAQPVKGWSPPIEQWAEIGDSPLYDLPGGREPGKWERHGLTDEELGELVERSSLWGRTASGPVQLGRPLLPLKIGHIPMVLASGRLNGMIGDHVARARIDKVWKVVETKIVEDANGKEKALQVQKQSVRLSIRVLSKRAGRARIHSF